MYILNRLTAIDIKLAIASCSVAALIKLTVGDNICQIRQKIKPFLIFLLSPIVPPREPQWIDDRPSPNKDRLVKDDLFDKVCGVEGGRPPANITFYLDNDEITDPNVAHQVEYYDNNYDNNTSAVRRLSYRLRADDDGKTITCRALHFAYPEGHSDVPFKLRVFCKCANIVCARSKLIFFVTDPPQQLPDVTVYGVQEGKSAFATVTIQANPRPRTGWFIEGGISVDEGAYQERYEARNPIALVSSNLLPICNCRP